MTYNLLGAQGDDSVFSEWSGWAARVTQLAPDVLVVQEAQSGDVGAIALRTAGRYRIASYGWWACDGKGDPEGVAILVRSGWTVRGAAARSLGSSCEDPTMRRVLAWADIERDGVALRVYGTHLTAGGGAAASSREAQVRELRAAVAADDPDGRGRWVVAGDLNLTPSSALYRMYFAPSAPTSMRMLDGYASAAADAADSTVCPTLPGEPAALAELLADPDRGRRCGYSAGWPKDDNLLGCDLLSLCGSWERRRDLPVRERIDYVALAPDGPFEVVGGWTPSRIDADWASPGAEWFRLSDHLPVVVDLSAR